MKTRALLTVLALTCATAFAQTSGSSANRDASTAQRNQSSAAADSQSKGSGEGLVAKTKRALHNMGDKLRSAGNKAKSNDKQTAGTSGSDTRSMGAGAADTSDGARRARMDQAYSNSKNQQK
jgi:hypothetical protein